MLYINTHYIHAYVHVYYTTGRGEMILKRLQYCSRMFLIIRFFDLYRLTAWSARKRGVFFTRYSASLVRYFVSALCIICHSTRVTRHPEYHLPESTYSICILPLCTFLVKHRSSSCGLVHSYDFRHFWFFFSR